MKAIRYRPARDLYHKIFGTRVQKISIDAGFTCPNRDGTLAKGGCTYCINSSFTPYYVTRRKTIKQQLEEGISFFSQKYKSWKYIAYFQAYTNTYAPLEELKRKYSQALDHPDVVGIDISTRPDCVDEQILDYLAGLNKTTFVMIEYGVESTINATLDRVNRAHTYEQAQWVIRETARRGILQSAHLIIGLPGESREDILSHADKISQLPVYVLKLHQLQILRGTRMARDYQQNPHDYHLFTVEEYVDLMVEFLERLNPSIYIDRFTNESPPDLVIAPRWGGLKNFEITHMIERRLAQRNTWQGRLFRQHTKDK